MKVENLINDRGNVANNQIIIRDNGAIYFHSYKTTIAKYENGKLTLKDGWGEHSMTTNKHLYMFLRNHTQFFDIYKKSQLVELIEIYTFRKLNDIQIGEVKQFDIYNIKNDRNNSARNQFVIDDKENRCVYFQSYDSMIAKYERNNFYTYLTDMWDYSATTRKHLYIFLRDYCGFGYCVKKDVLALIESEEIILRNFHIEK